VFLALILLNLSRRLRGGAEGGAGASAWEGLSSIMGDRADTVTTGVDLAASLETSLAGAGVTNMPS